MRRSPFFTLVLCFFFVVQPALAADSPKEILQDITTRIQKDGSPAPLLDYVHWEVAFTQLTERQKSEFDVKDAEGLKKFYYTYFNKPAVAIKHNLEKKFSSLPPGQKSKMMAQLDQLVSIMAYKMKASREKLSKSKWEVGDQKIEGDKAFVDLAVTNEIGQIQRETMEFIKVDNKWYLPELGFLSLNNDQGEKAPSSRPAASKNILKR